jgi:hypothetical protein
MGQSFFPDTVNQTRSYFLFRFTTGFPTAKQSVGSEWRLVCAVSNLLTLFRSGGTLETA